MKKILSSIVIALALIVGAQYSSARIYNPPASGLTSLTPWTENVSAGGFSLSNLLNLTSTGTTTLATTTATKFTVTGQTTLGNASSSALTVSGQTTLASTTASRVVIGDAGSQASIANDAALEVFGTTNAIIHAHNIGAQGATAGAAIIAYSAPTGASILSGTRFGTFIAGGSKDTVATLANTTAMSSFATENWSATSTGAKIAFETTANGTTTRATTLELASTGATITGNLNVSGTYAPRVVSYDSASTTINVDTTDIASTTISTATTFVNPTGTPVAGQMFEIWGTATGTQTVYWGTNFASSTDLVNVSSVATGTTKWLFEYRPTSAKYELVGLLKVFDN